jgi:Kef-type K+ transport system membrane component KefB
MERESSPAGSQTLQVESACATNRAGSLAVNLLLENLLEPALLGDSLDMHPLPVLLVTSLGGFVAGMVGLILAASLTAILFDVQHELKATGFFDEDGPKRDDRHGSKFITMTWVEIQATVTFGFSVVGLIVVFGPILAEKLRLPGLLGLLVGGALIGPNMLNVLPDVTGLESIGSIGVLYLIFLAGVQLDIDSFVRYRRISFGFGLLTAFIPFGLGIVMSLALGIDLAASILIGSFWASFTLITYPTLTRYGLTRNRAVAATVGASSITDTISLIILALVIGSETGDTGGARLILGILAGLAFLAVWCFGVVPAIARWFFSGLGEERSIRFMFVLVSLTSSAVVADLVEIEPLIGAFFVGVGLNRIVPNKSPLMSLTDFFGNAFFIPTFLVSVGLLFDPEVMFVGGTIRLAIGFGIALFVGKVAAAWLSGKLFGLSGAEVGLMASVSIAQAAATLAATIVGLEAGLYGDDVVNAVMVVVAVSLVATSIGASRFAPQIPPPVDERRRIGEAVLLPVDGDEASLSDMILMAAKFTDTAGGVVQPLVVVTSTENDAIEHGREQQARGRPAAQTRRSGRRVRSAGRPFDLLRAEPCRDRGRVIDAAPEVAGPQGCPWLVARRQLQRDRRRHVAAGCGGGVSRHRAGRGSASRARRSRLRPPTGQLAVAAAGHRHCSEGGAARGRPGRRAAPTGDDRGRRSRTARGDRAPWRERRRGFLVVCGRVHGTGRRHRHPDARPRHTLRRDAAARPGTDGVRHRPQPRVAVVPQRHHDDTPLLRHHVPRLTIGDVDTPARTAV